MAGTANGTAEEPERVAELVRGAQRGDALAMDELLTVLTPRVARVCGPIALEDGPDAAQEALIAIFRNIGQLKSPEALFGWARAIAAREALRYAKRRNRVVVAEIADRAAEGVDVELSADIEDVLGRLTPEHRLVLAMRHVEGLDEQEVSEALRIPVGTVRSRLFRAREAFRRAWA
ncbi:RNA polymerase sigma factor [Streptomyces sp. NPDC093225]|uniref:RNA polymerase sigma factor n=1 Tax=Streptomyces sp. NPDC093225 TaxID=3366034 RepID=UPI0038026876